ncbi:MAG: DUF2490 domain-containing protein [Deltaproteobacteria bacterium]|nr:DUF2490 domain-containing protein [Deltaproteobacteria bacterium]
MKTKVACWAAAIAAVAAVSLSAPRAAHAFEVDEQLWGAVVLQAPVAGKLRLYAEAQGRRLPHDDTRMMLRPALNYGLGSGFTAWAGYAWTPQLTPVFKDEHRAWQQLTHQADVREVTLVHRLRLEQRFIETLDGPSWRVRFMPRFVYRPKAWHGFGVVVWDEIMFHLASPDRGPKPGLDQNRFAVGFQYAVSKKLIFEPTYVANAFYRPNRDGRLMHTALLVVWVNL